MKYLPVFFDVGQNHYRLHLPYLLPNCEKATLQSDGGERFDSDERHYWIKGYTYGSSVYDVQVMEVGSDLAPARIEAWFYQGGANVEIPADLKGMIVMRNEEATQNHVLVYVNNKRVS